MFIDSFSMILNKYLEINYIIGTFQKQFPFKNIPFQKVGTLVEEQIEMHRDVNAFIPVVLSPAASINIQKGYSEHQL